MLKLFEETIGFGAEAHTREERESEYRIPERDLKDSVKFFIKKGTRVEFTRAVLRVGYEVDKYSVTMDEWRDAGLSIVAGKTNLDKETVQRVIAALEIKSPFKGLRNEIYQKLIKPKIPKNPVRAMFFIDPKCVYVWGRHEEHVHYGNVTDRVVRYTGKYDAGCSTGGDYWGGYDYEPPSISMFCQRLYEVEDLCCGTSRLVYPDDLIVKNENT